MLNKNQLYILTNKCEFNRHNGHEYRIIAMKQKSDQISLLHIDDIAQSLEKNNIVIDIPGIALSKLIYLSCKYGLRKVFLQDSQTLYFKSRISFLIKSKNMFSKAFFFSGLKMLMFFLKELIVCSLYKKIGFVSESDAFIFKKIFKKKIYVINNGVEIQEKKLDENHQGSNTIKFFFWGNMQYAPNKDSFIFLLNNYWSKLSDEFNVELNIYGFGSMELKDYITGYSNIHLKGKFDSLSQIFSQDYIFLNFVEYGSGVKNKTLESLSNHVPMIAAEHSIIGTGLESHYRFRYSNYSELLDCISRIKPIDKVYSDEIRNLIKLNFNWSNSTKEYLKI